MVLSMQLGGVEAREYPEDWSNSIADLRAKQAAMVESADQQADSKMNHQTSTLTVTPGKSCGGAKDKGKINLRSPLKEEASGSVLVQNKPTEEKFSFVFDPRNDATIYHE